MDITTNHPTKSNLESLLARLIAMPTVTGDQTANRRALHWIKQQIAHLPLHVVDFEHGGFASLLITTHPNKQPKVWLAAHLDVVPGTPATFVPRGENGRLYGRGAWDMKFAIACYLQLLLELGDRLPDYDIGVMITTDEEVGGANGTAALVEAGYGADIVILPDSGDELGLEHTSKGCYGWRAAATGVAGHGSRTWQYPSANLRLINFLADLAGQFPSEPCAVPDHYHDTMNIGKVSGGSTINQVADSAEALFEIRITAQADPVEMKRMMATTLKRHPGVTVKLEIDYPAHRVDLTDPLIKRFVDALALVSGKHPKLIASHATSDAVWWQKADVPVVLAKPAGGGHHGDHEWVDLAQLAQFYQAIKIYIESVAQRRELVGQAPKGKTAL